MAMPGSRSIHAAAPAKLNLALSVGPPNADGMHPITTWMVTVDLFDELHLTRLEPEGLARYAVLWHQTAKRPSAIDWPLTRELSVRAHLALEKRVGRRLPLELKLHKRIPVGGGLGGGSSDAAAMLRATNELFGLALSESELHDIATGLGSDVAFFLVGGSAIVEGLGDRIEPHQVIRELYAVVVFPADACPTGQVYAAFDELEPEPPRPQAVRALAAGNGPLGPDEPFNDLAPAALRLAPSLRGHLKQISELAKRPAHVAGSGSSLFVICDDPLHAEKTATAIEQRLDLPAVAVRSAAVPRPRRE